MAFSVFPGERDREPYEGDSLRDAREHLAECESCRNAVDDAIQMALDGEKVLMTPAGTPVDGEHYLWAEEMMERLKVDAGAPGFVDVRETPSWMEVVLASTSESLDLPQQVALASLVRRMRAHPGSRVQIMHEHEVDDPEPHALFLGSAVADYIAEAGIAEDRLRIVIVEKLMGVPDVPGLAKVYVLVQG